MSKAAVTCPCSAPSRTSKASPRAPSASEKASSTIDLPAPVSPVSAESARAKSISRRSMRTMSRMERWISINAGFYLRRRGPSQVEGNKSAERQRLECLADPGVLVLARLAAARLHELIGVLIPGAGGEVMAEHRRRGLRLVHDAKRHVALGQPHQRLLDVTGRLVLGDDRLEAVDGADKVPFLEIEAADHHLLAGELVARDFDLLLRAFGIFGVGIFARHLGEHLHRPLGAGLVAG